MSRLLVATFALTLAGCGCETVDSSSVKTSGLYADLEAEAAGDGRTKLKASLKLGQGSLTFLELAEGDTLIASSGGTDRTMSRTSLFGATWYVADFTADAADTAFSIALQRTSDTSAPSSTVTLPAPFSFVAPAASTQVPRSGSGLRVTWQLASSGDGMRISASGSCIESVSEVTIADSGAHDFAAFRARQDENNTTCPVTITLERRREGTVDPAYGKGGAFVAKVSRKLTVSSMP
jgi:hypothetical protein